MKNITPFLWFNGNAKEAAEFYCAIFPGARITHTAYYPEATEHVSRKPKGTVMTVNFELNGQPFVALNGGNEFSFTPAISFMVHCDTQKEIDEYWERLGADGGQHGQCGWLTDRFGVSWQVVPTMLDELLEKGDDAKREQVMTLLLTMTKIDIHTLQSA